MAGGASPPSCKCSLGSLWVVVELVFETIWAYMSFISLIKCFHPVPWFYTKFGEHKKVMTSEKEIGHLEDWNWDYIRSCRFEGQTKFTHLSFFIVLVLFCAVQCMYVCSLLALWSLPLHLPFYSHNIIQLQMSLSASSAVVRYLDASLADDDDRSLKILWWISHELSKWMIFSGYPSLGKRGATRDIRRANSSPFNDLPETL